MDLDAGMIKKIVPFVIFFICVCAGVGTLALISGQPSEGGLFENVGALYITASNATLKTEYYHIENQWSDVKIRFEFKEDNSDVWNYTDWQEISEDVENGTLYEDVGNLSASTRYEFKAVLQHDSELISSPISSFETYAIPLSYEASGILDYTVDGDTVQVNLTWVNPATAGVQTGSGQRVRFSGGVDAPELNDVEGGVASKEFVRDNFCSWGTEVFLDLDNLSDVKYHDDVGRLLGVIYVKKDGKWVNVNAELLRWGQEAYPDHDWLRYTYYNSEFDPYQWLENDYPYLL